MFNKIALACDDSVCMGLLLLQLRLNYHDLVMQAIEFAFRHSVDTDRLLRCTGCCCTTTAKMLLIIIRLYHFIMNYFFLHKFDIVRRTFHTMESLHAPNCARR